MSVTTALYTGVSGLLNNGEAMNVIGNNISNVNTVGYKQGRTLFSDLLSQNIGKGGSQVGTGSQVQKVQNIFTQGTSQASENVTDLSIVGNSFFALKAPSVEVTTQNTAYLSRAGAFSVDKNLTLVNPEGYQVLDTSGQPIVFVNSGSSPTTDFGKITKIEANGVITYLATDGVTQNFYNKSAGTSGASAADTVSAAASASAAAAAIAESTIDAAKVATDAYVAAQALSDATPADTALEAAAATAKAAAKAANASAATAAAAALTAATAADTAAAAAAVAAPGDAALVLAAASAATALVDATATDAAATAAAAAADPDAGLTDAADTAAATASGTADTASIDAASAAASTGDTAGRAVTAANAATVQRVAVISVTDPGALSKIGGSLYQSNANSGVATTAFSLAGNKPNGTSESIQSNYLEGSNVDMASEFVKMIVTQRAYSANSKTITTADQMTQEVLGLIR